MNRRQFIQAGVMAVGAGAVTGRVGAGNMGDALGEGDDGFPAYELPEYSQWVPADSQVDPETGVFFTHVDWETLMAIDDDDEPDDEPEDDMEEVEEIIEQIPILGLPFYGAFVTPLAMFTLLFYPFTEDILPDEDEPDVDGIDTATMTMTDELVIFHGDYDRDVFEAQYTDGFEDEEERDEFIVYVGAEAFTEGLAFALSDDTLVAGMMPGEDDEFSPEDLVDAALDRHLEETNRLIDEEDGQWLLETTGEAPMSFGAWETDDLLEAIDPDEDAPDGPDDQDQDDQDLNADLDTDDNPVFDDVESVVNNMVFDVVDGEMRDIEARFAGLYPEDTVPSETEVLEYLIGDEDVPHDIVIEGRRVHATATFEEPPEE